MKDKYNPLTIRHAVNLAAPHTFAASAAPALFGILYCAVKGYPLAPWKDAALFTACILLQASVNVLNDYADFIKGTDNQEDNLEASDAVLLYENIDPRSALLLGIGYLLTGILLGVLASIGAGFLPLLIGCAGVAAIVLYSGGPKPISYLPIGELVSGTVMGGLIPLGICACADGSFHADVLPASLPLILGIGLIMLCNNGCDIEKDREAGRATFPAHVGRVATLKLYRFAIIAWIVLLIAVPVFLIGPAGGITAVLLFAAGKTFRHLLKLKLEPEGRIDQMKSIAKANFIGNGSLCLTLLIYCLAGALL